MISSAGARGVVQLSFEVSRQGVVTRREAAGPTVTLGRRSTSSIAFPDDTVVSRDHATIEVRNGECLIADRNTQNHTFVNGLRIDGPRLLAVGDTIRLGASGPTLRLVAVTPAGGAAASAGDRRGDEAAGSAAGLSARSASAGSRAEPSVPPAAAPARRLLVGVNAAGSAPQRGSAAGSPSRPEPAGAKPARGGQTILNLLNARLEQFTRRQRLAVWSLVGVCLAAVAGGVIGGRTLWSQIQQTWSGVVGEVDRKIQDAKPTDWAELGESLKPGLAYILVRPEAGPGNIGSGFLIDAAGLVATNYHVIENAGQVTVQFADSEQEFASPGYVFASKPLDLAVIKVDLPAGRPRPTFKLSAGKVRPLEPVAVFGSPQGMRHVLSHGTVQKVDMLGAMYRELGRSTPSDFTDRLVILHGAEAAPGNSGGPLVNDRGEVIGVMSMAFEPLVEIGGNTGRVVQRRFLLAIHVKHLRENLPAAGAPVEAYEKLPR